MKRMTSRKIAIEAGWDEDDRALIEAFLERVRAKLAAGVEVRLVGLGRLTPTDRTYRRKGDVSTEPYRRRHVEFKSDAGLRRAMNGEAKS